MSIARAGCSSPTPPTPLAAAFLFGGIQSLAAGTVGNAIYFITTKAYGYSSTLNFTLGIIQGLTYIVGALAVGPALRWAERAYPSLTPRRVLGFISLALALLCALPAVVRNQLAPGSAPTAGSWAVWVLVSIYFPVCGCMWPIVQSYVSGGRTARGLRSAIGGYNVLWSATAVLGLVVISPALEHHPLDILAATGAVHLLAALSLPLIRSTPGSHVDDRTQPHPPQYRGLLATHRSLLPMTYFVMNAMLPMLPSLYTRIGFGAAIWPLVTASWHLARVATFLAMQIWHGWQGRWESPVIGTLLLLGGFVGVILAPEVGVPEQRGPCLALLLISLIAFGTGAAAIYTAALYYVMETKTKKVDAGGSHEALIGVGYTTGPLCGLAAAAFEGQGGAAAGHGQWVVIAFVGIGALLAIGVAYAVRLTGRDIHPASAPDSAPLTGEGEPDR
ncbi:MAG: hypothetical protein JNM07_08695 [Phycisphaerae bacterium]|nr:hypothetical protein [Phycisphaerae bacterium]